jgi:hypothetical protein
MIKRGRILREPGAEPGLLIVDGQQFRFSPDGLWKSQMAPKAGLVLDVDFDANHRIASITPVAESQSGAGQQSNNMTAARKEGAEIMGKIVEKFGAANLVALGLILVGWFFLTTVSIQLPILGKTDFTFWQVLGFLNAGSALEAVGRGPQSSAGIYGFFALIALAGPFAYRISKEKRLALFGLTPLLVMLIVWLIARNTIASAFGGNMGELGREAQAEVMQAVSLGFGAYLSGLASLYFAGIAIKNFFQARNAATQAAGKSKPATA